MKLPEGWKDDLPNEYKDSGVLTDITDINEFAKLAVDARNFASTAIRIPGQDASVEVKAAFNADVMAKMPNLIAVPEGEESWDPMFKRMGRPDAVDGYELPDMPEPIKANLSGLTEKGHELGLNQTQMKGVVDTIIGDYKANVEIAVGKAEEDGTKLKGEWGGAHDQKIKNIAHFSKQLGFSEGFIKAIENGGIAMDDMKALDSVVAGYQGDGSLDIGQQPGHADTKITPAEAEMQINEIMGNKEGAYWDAADPNHKAMQDKVIELGVIAEEAKQKTEIETFRESLYGG